MTYFVKESDHKDAKIISDFNEDLKNHEINFKLPLSDTKNLNTDDFISINNFILLDDKTKVRAGYTLKSQWFKINNEILQIGYYYNPVSAGLYNKKYNFCGLMLLNDAQKKNKNLFSLGMGGFSEPLPKLLKSLNWDLQSVPFFFKIYNTNNFLKNIKHLKNTKLKYFLIEILTKTGLGWLLIKFISLLTSIFNMQFKKKISVTVAEINQFDEELNFVWDKTKENKSFSAIRNTTYLKTLYEDKRFIKLKFSENNKVVGWSISLCTKLNNHKHFGQMRLGSIVDCLCLKGYEDSVVRETSNLLKSKGVDLIVSNQSHIFWKKAFKINSFLKGPSNFIFASSKILSDRLKEKIESKNYIHLTRGDGDGPINL